MGGKRSAQGDAQGGDAAASGDTVQAGSWGASQKRQTLGLSVDGAAGWAEGGPDELGSILAPVAMCFSMRFDPSALAVRKAALEAALLKVVTEFGGLEFKLGRVIVGPSEDTLQRVLPLVLERVQPEGGQRCFDVCTSWRRELEARGFCCKTVRLCAALAAGGDVEDLGQIALRQLRANIGGEPEFWSDAMAFLQRSLGWRGGLREYLQAASQEPEVSFLSRGAASTAECLGWSLVHWVDKPQGRYPGLRALPGHASIVRSVAFSPDGKWIVSGAEDKFVKIWKAETGAEVSSFVRLRSLRWGGGDIYVRVR